MPGLSVVGLQWGDEGKGKLMDALSKDADIVARLQAGGNAGHTVYVKDDGKEKPEKYVFHHVPSGAIYCGKTGRDVTPVIANGVVVNILDLLEEVDTLSRQLNFDLLSVLKISERCHLVLPHHIARDIANEKAAGDGKIGTTRKGIGPCMEDKKNRKAAIRMADLMYGDEAFARARITAMIEETGLDISQVLRDNYACDTLDQFLDMMMAALERVRQCVCDTAVLLQKAHDASKQVVYEGAQAFGLDEDHGTYPMTTSGITTVHGLYHGAGIPAWEIDREIGVTKIYCTRVGGGPFATQDDEGDDVDRQGRNMRKAGNEYGATTGRPRRCGWMDLPMLKRAVTINGLKEICVTKVDVLDNMETVRVCTGYEIEGQPIDYVPATIEELEKVTPIYRDFPGWQCDTTQAHSWDELPQQLRNVIEFIETETGTFSSFVSNGPEREHLIEREKPQRLIDIQRKRRELVELMRNAA